MIDLAIKQAKKSEFRRAQVGAVIVSGGRVISTGINQIRGYKGPKKRRWLDSMHAELHAILNSIKSGAYDNLKGATMFLAHIRPSGTIGNSCPCEYCMETIRESGKFKKVVFTTKTGEVAEIRV